MRIQRLITTAVLLLQLGLAASAETIYDRMIFQETELRPTVTEQSGGRAIVSLQDPAVKRLIELSSARLQWSSTGQTLYVYAPGRESFWAIDSSRVTVNGQEITAPGRLYGEPQQAFMEPNALLYALCLRAFPGTDGTRLMPVVNGLAFTPGPYASVSVKASAPLSYSVEKPEAGLVVVTFQNLLWAGEQNTYIQGSVQASVQGGDRVESPLVLRLQYPPAWDGEVKPGAFRNELTVTPNPSNQLVGAGPPVKLDRIDYRRIDGDDMVIFFAQEPVRFSWDFNQATRQLVLEFPGVTMDQVPSNLETPGAPLLQGHLEQVQAEGVPVLRFTGTLSQDCLYEFFEIEGARGSLAMRVASASKLTALESRGTATTRGYVASGGRGVIVIDPGHGGGDPGCYSRSEGVYEKDVTLDIARRLRDVLVRQGWKVIMTRDDDRDVTYAGSPDKMELQARCDVANTINADLFISIHCNASVSGAHYGTSIHWYKEADYDFARSLEYSLGEAMGLGQKGLIRNSFYVLRHTEMPAVLVETAYLTNAHEASMLVQPAFRQKMAERLAVSLGQFMAGRYARANGYKNQQMR